MATRKRKTTIKTQSRSSRPLSDQLEGYLSQIKLGESYTSLILGAIVVVIAVFLVFSFAKMRNTGNKAQVGTSSSQTAEQKTQAKQLPKTYTVKEGESLWTIAESVYGSGYNWVDLAKANKLANPGVISAGDKLVVPDVKPIVVANAQNTEQPVANPITGKSYTVEKGDYLWSIAVRAYGDGYKWVEIANANHLSNPDMIFSGNVLTLPR